MSQPLMCLSACTMAKIGAKPFQYGRRRNNDPALTACLHHYPSQPGKPVVLDRSWQKCIHHFGCGMPSEWAQPEVSLAFDSLTLAVPFRREVIIDRFRKNVDLLGDKRDQSSRRPFTGSQRTAREA